jgi:hypothetical protein
MTSIYASAACLLERGSCVRHWRTIVDDFSEIIAWNQSERDFLSGSFQAA